MKTTLSLLALLMGTTLAQAQTLGAWNTAGDVLASGNLTQLTTSYDTDTPAPLSGTGAVDRYTLESLTGLPDGGLDLSIDRQATEGSLLYQSFSALAGQTLSFDWSFSTLDTVNQDRAFVVLNGQVSTLNSFAGAGSGHFSTLFGASGTVNLFIGVADIQDVEGTSTLALSNIALSAAPVPEPASVALLLGGLGLVAWRRRAVKR